MTAIDFIAQKARMLDLDSGAVVANLAHYRTQTGFYSRRSLWDSAESTHPVIWWQGLCTLQPLTPICSQILNGPPSSASCERNWSVHGNIHSKRRNRLAQEKVEKLVAIQTNLKICENIQHEYNQRPFPLLHETMIKDDSDSLEEDELDSGGCGSKSDSDDLESETDPEYNVPLSMLRK